MKAKDFIIETPIPQVPEHEEDFYYNVYGGGRGAIPDTHEFVGSGIQAKVIKSKDQPAVIKVQGERSTLANNGTLQYLLLSRKYSSTNLYLPKIHSIQQLKPRLSETRHTFFVFHLEELHPLEDVSQGFLKIICNQVFKNWSGDKVNTSPFGNPFTKIINNKLFSGIKDKQFLSAIKAVRKIAERTESRIDMHGENMMVRITPGGPHLVLTDPLV